MRFFLDQKFPSGSGVGIMGEMMLCVRPCGMVCDFCGSSLRDIVTWERFLGAIYIYIHVLIASSCLHGNLQVSTNLPHGYQQLMLKTNLRTLQSERHPPRHGGSVGSQTAGQICSKICFQSIFQARIAEVFGIIIHSMGLGLRLQCSAGEICTTTLARSWSIWSQITLLCCESQGVSGRSASWMKKKR